jgi:predicted lipoprotein with Yx(FWY)xxD motif
MSAPRRLPAAAVLAVGTLSLAACGSGTSYGGSSAASSSSSSSQTSASGASKADYTISAAAVPGVGTVLVNGSGMTLYVLSSEKGGRITCTDDNGCTKVWPDSELPSGVTQAIAGSGIDASKLGTVKDAAGGLYITYAGWPLYTFSGDSGPRQAHGQGITSFGGTWATLTVSGSPVTAAAGSGSTTSSSSGYGY